MKFATLNDGTRDGELIVVNKTMTKYTSAVAIASNLQYALDNWEDCSARLETLASCVDKNGHKLDVNKLYSPLPRAYEWIDGSAYINHIVLVRKARNAEPPETLRTEPLIYQGGSSVFLSPREDIPFVDASWGLDFESEISVVLGDTPMGTKKEDAHKYIKLVMLVNDVSLRGLIPGELKKGFGFFNSKPASAFSPCAVTLDELGDNWQDGRVHLPMITTYNKEIFGTPNAGKEMHFSFYELIEHICKTRAFSAGTILGSGTVSNEDRSKGASCLAEKRMIETIDTGKPITPFMQPNDTIEIEMFSDTAKKESIFGRIVQKVVQI